MRVRILVLMFSCAFFKLYAQGYYLNPEGFNYKMSPCNLIIDSIVDVREEQDCIGFVCTGLLEKPTAAYLEQPLKFYFNNYFLRNSKPDENSEHLILRINKLIIYEVTSSNGQTAVAELNLSFITKNGDKYLEKFQAGATSERGPGTITIQHQRNILDVLEKCIDQYKERNKYFIRSGKNNFPETDLHTNPLTNTAYKIDGITHFTRGIYPSFFDFRDYTPDTISIFKVEYVGDNSDPKYAMLKTMGGDVITWPWAFSDGKQNYIRLTDAYYPLKKEGNYFALFDRPDKFAPMFFVSTPDIITGLIISAAISGASSGLANSSKYGKKEKYNINLSSGRFFLANSSGDIKIESRIVILSSRYNKPDAEMELFVNGEKQCVLGKGSYTVLSLNSAVKDVDICLKINGEKVCEISQPELFNTDLYLVVVKGDKIKIDHPNRDKRNELIAKIKEGNFSRVEKMIR